MVLTGVSQWFGHHPAFQNVVGMIPGEGTCLSCGPCPWLGVSKRQPIDVSLAHRCVFSSLSPSLPLSLKINEILKKITIVKELYFHSKVL